MNRKVEMSDGTFGVLIGIFQYGSIMNEEGTEPLAVIEAENGEIRDAVSLNGFKFVKEGK